LTKKTNPKNPPKKTSKKSDFLIFFVENSPKLIKKKAEPNKTPQKTVKPGNNKG